MICTLGTSSTCVFFFFFCNMGIDKQSRFAKSQERNHSFQSLATSSVIFEIPTRRTPYNKALIPP